MGLPLDWKRVSSWSSNKADIPSWPCDPVVKKPLKNKEVKILDDYSIPASESFWDTFPKNMSLDGSKTTLDTNAFSELLENSSEVLTTAEIMRGEKSVRFLCEGGPAYQKTTLPGCFVENAPSAVKFGDIVTDNIATWIKKDFVSGPFACPPLDNFRVNSLMAVDQNEKVRLVLNVSLPHNKSFNSNIAEEKMEKVKMSSARQFGYSMVKAGKNSRMSKFDLTDAYKNIPCKEEDLRLQGFFWLGKFFIEKRMIFGARTAVGNFDIFGNSLRSLALARSSIPASLVHRQLDDVPSVAPEKTGWDKEFADNYETVCKRIKVGLAEDCPKREKAFRNVTSGKVLGIFFDSVSLSWMLPDDKKQRALADIKRAVAGESLDLLSMQKLMGRLNDISLMCPYLNGFKRPLLDDLRSLQSMNGKSMALSYQSRKDLLTWAGMLADKDVWLPIAREPQAPPVYRKEFSSDAAGLAKDSSIKDGPGVASIGISESGEICFAFSHSWSKEMISFGTDSKGKRFGDKSTTLELIGLLLPFILVPEQLRRQHVVLKVDNMACIFGWESRHVVEDRSASILLRCIHVISAFLESVVHVVHLPRVSSWESIMVDDMSRRKTTTESQRALLDSFNHLALPVIFREWLENPTDDWNLPFKLLSIVKLLVK